jgi:predicted PurR-regulated permease PerM
MNPAERYRNRVLTLVAVILSVAALKASYPVTMPILFACVIVAALWPLKLWLDRWLPSWSSYVLTMAALVAILGAFAAAVYLSMGQVLGVLGAQWPEITELYDAAARQASEWGLAADAGLIDQRRIIGFAETLASSVYGFATYTGFIALLVMLGMPEVARLQEKLREELERDARSEVRATVVSISQQVRRYFSTTLATSILTGVASTLWAFATGLDLPLVWGLLNFVLNFIPIVGNIVGIIPPALYAVLQFDGIAMPLLVFAGFAALQIVISNFVYPVLQGRRLSLSPLAIIMAMTFWSWVWGIAGALIAVPITAAVVIVCDHFERSRWIAKAISA